MPPSIPPSPTPSKEPPDKASSGIKPSFSPRPNLGTVLPGDPDLDQPPASPTVRPPFAPFFTLITDTARGTIHHPKNVHYIFSDDDPSLLTEACIQTLNPSPSTSSSFSRSQQQQQQRAPSTDDTSSSASKSPSSSTNSPSQNSKFSQQPHLLLLDLSSSGTAIRSAHSLSSSWQILSTALTPAPTWATAESPSDAPNDPSNPASGFMLKISGTDGSLANGDLAGPDVGLGLVKNPIGKGTQTMAAGILSEADFAGLVRDFEARMKVLRTVVEAGAGLGLDDEELEAEDRGQERIEKIADAVEEEENPTTTALTERNV